MSSFEVNTVWVFTLATGQDVIAEIRKLFDVQGNLVLSLHRPFAIGKNDKNQIQLMPVRALNPLIEETIEVPFVSITMMYQPNEKVTRDYKSAKSGIIHPVPKAMMNE